MGVPGRKDGEQGPERKDEAPGRRDGGSKEERRRAGTGDKRRVGEKPRAQEPRGYLLVAGAGAGRAASEGVTAESVGGGEGGLWQ